MLDLFLSDKYKHHWPEIQKLAASDAPQDFEKLRKYALEAYRLATPAFGLLRKVVVDEVEIKDGHHTIHAKKDDQVFVNFVRSPLHPVSFAFHVP